MPAKIWALPGETDIILWLQSLGGEGSFIYYFMQFFTLFGEEIILVALIGFLYWGIDKKRGEQLGVTVMTANMLFPLIKNIVRRARPFQSNSLISGDKKIEIFKESTADGYSFPSGHSAGSASGIGGLAWVLRDKKQKWLTVCAIVIPLLVALSRMYLGAHYLTDVICGLAIGYGVIFLVNWLLQIVPKYYLYIGILIVGLVGFFYCTTEDFYTAYGIMFGMICGVFFEEKITKFENTKVWWRILLRIVGGGILYIGLNEGLKAVVGAIYPDYKLDFHFERFFRTIRYAVIIFLAIGVYPMLFKVTDKLWQKLGWIKSNTQIAESDIEH